MMCYESEGLVMGCIQDFVGIILYVFNVALAICGIGIIATGSLMEYGLSSGLADVVGVGNTATPGVLITVGCGVVIVAFYGGYGAWYKDKQALYAYAGIMMCLFVAELVIGIYVLVNWNGLDVTPALQAFFLTDLEAYSGGFQEFWECCGISGPTDYIAIVFEMPSTCCEEDVCTSPFASFYDGCAQVLNDWFSTNSKIIGSVAIGFAVVELSSSIAAWLVAYKPSSSSSSTV